MVESRQQVGDDDCQSDRGPAPPRASVPAGQLSAPSAERQFGPRHVILVRQRFGACPSRRLGDARDGTVLLRSHEEPLYGQPDRRANGLQRGDRRS